MMKTANFWNQRFAALLGGNELLISPDVERDDKFIALLVEQEAQFMDQVRRGCASPSGRQPVLPHPPSPLLNGKEGYFYKW